MLKRLIKNAFFQKLFVFIFLIFYRLLYWSWRKKLILNSELKEILKRNEYFAIACWHQNNFTNIWASTKIKTIIMASPSLEGKLIGMAIESLGGKIAWGSSRKKPVAALKSLIRMCRETRRCPVITVDGPIGPAKIPKPGIIEVSRLARVGISPLGTAASSYWTLKNTWDETRIPKPFSKVVFYFDKTIPCGDLNSKSAEDLQTLALRIEDAQRQALEFV